MYVQDSICDWNYMIYNNSRLRNLKVGRRDWEGIGWTAKISDNGYNSHLRINVAVHFVKHKTPGSFDGVTVLLADHNSSGDITCFTIESQSTKT